MQTRFKDSVDRAAAPGLLGLIGETPMLRLERITSHLAPGVSLVAKAEWFNPGGSVKDRPAAAILQHALDTGELGQGRTLLDSSSGNMGISYATLGTSLGLHVCLAVPANASPERLAILRAHGVELHLTDPTEGSDGARRVAPSCTLEPAATTSPINSNRRTGIPLRTTGPRSSARHRSVTHFVAASAHRDDDRRRPVPARADPGVTWPCSPMAMHDWRLKHLPTPRPEIYDRPPMRPSWSTLSRPCDGSRLAASKVCSSAFGGRRSRCGLWPSASRQAS
jgi:hypothetical protein